MTIQNEDVFRPHPRTAYRNIGGKMVVINTKEEKLLRLNRTGTEVWERLDGHSVKEIAQEISILFDKPSSETLDDVIEFIETLLEKQLIVISRELEK